MMKRLGMVIAAALVVTLSLGSPALALGSCVSRGGGPASGHPGVVLGPATKCVRTSGSDGVANFAPPGSSETHSFPWEPLAIAAGVIVASVCVRRSFSGRMHIRKAA